MIPALPVIVVGAHLLVAAAEQVPVIDVTPGCRAAADALGVSIGVQTCVNSELAARDQLAKTWASFSAADRTTCLSLTKMGSNGTYTDLLTCLEITRDARALPKEPGLVGQGTR